MNSGRSLPNVFHQCHRSHGQMRSGVRGAPLPFRRFGTWNVEGLKAEEKLEQIFAIMRKDGIDVMCIQETHIAGSSYCTKEGYLVIMSGGPMDAREYAGVGFIVSPWATRAVISFIQHSPRIAGIKLRTPGGNIGLVSVYAPHSGHTESVRQEFHTNLRAFVDRFRAHGPIFVLGDLNAKLHRCRPGEQYCMGEHAYGDATANLDGANTNRNLLLETCRAKNFVIANTFFPRQAEETVTYYNLSTKLMEEVVKAVSSSMSNQAVHSSLQVPRVC